MANWGAFAGGLAKGYLQESELEETQKRTKAIQDEAAIRKEQEARAKTKFEQDQQERAVQQAIDEGTQRIISSAKWPTGPDGRPDPTAPGNAAVWDQVFADITSLKLKHNRLPVAELKALTDMRETFKDEQFRAAGEKYLSTGDTSAFNGLSHRGVDLSGAKEVQVKQPWGTVTMIELANGSQIPKSALITMFNKDVGAALDRAEDNQRQSWVAQQQVDNMKRDDARAAEMLRITRDSAKVSEILGIGKAIDEQVLKPKAKDPISGEQKDTDPVYNGTASAMIADRLKKYATTTRTGAADAAAAVRDIASEIKTKIDELDQMVLATAKEKGASKEKLAEARKRAHADFVKNGFELPKMSGGYKPITEKKGAVERAMVR